MNIDVFGAVFLDKYIYENLDTVETMESIGGSGLNIALGLHMLGHDVSFHGNIGDDRRRLIILNKLKDYGFPVGNISTKNGESGLFMAKNDKVLSVERGANAQPLSIDINSLRGKCAILTTELNEASIQKILTYKWEKIFLDVGPRPHILKEIQLPKNTIKIGNTCENEIICCDVVKLGKHGAKWGSLMAKGNNASLPYTIGAGDLFDTILIHNILKGKDREITLNFAVEHAEKSCNIKGGFKFQNGVSQSDELHSF